MGKDFLSDVSINNIPEGLINVPACSFLFDNVILQCTPVCS